MQIDLPDNVIAFLKELANEIKTQDNRMTRSPYFYVVRLKEAFAAPADMGDGEPVYCCAEWDEQHTRPEWEIILKEYNAERPKSEWRSLDEFLDDDCVAYGTHFVDMDDNVFLTEKGYKQHMELNGHNYRSKQGPVQSYVKYAGRNPEMEQLLDAIMAFADVKKVKDDSTT